jgi:hydroxybutyrate-dimer hydrolase
MGLAGLAPTVSDAGDPAQLVARDLQQLRALVDVSPGGGYGTLYGPAVGGGPEKVAGKEYLALARDRDGQNITLLVQIPASFKPRSRASSPARPRARAGSTAPSAPRASGG